jgi:xylose isomerase
MAHSFRDLRYQQRSRNRAELLSHLSEFKLAPKLSVGIWYFTPGGGRFHDRFVPEASIEQRLEMAAEMAQFGVTGIEAHYPDEVNEENLHLYKQLEAQAGIRLVAVPFSHFFDRDFEFGSLSSPYVEVRRKAIDIAIGGLRLIRDAGADVAISWPGMDGYTYPMGTMYAWMWDRFEGAMAEAMDAVPGIRVAIEPKPYEPAANNIYRTTAEGILAAARIEGRLTHPENRALLKAGHRLVGLNPEVGHVRMGFEECAAAFTLIGLEGRLAHTHWNSQPLGNYDQDLNVGVVEWQQAEALLFALWVMGYEEWFGIDINPERMPVQTAIRNNAEVLKIMQERVEALPVERMLDCFDDPRSHRGELEMILARSMAYCNSNRS